MYQSNINSASQERSNNPFVRLYGKEALADISKEIDRLARNSNIPFDKKYLALGIQFMGEKATAVLAGRQDKKEIAALVSESFGEAAIYKYNIKNGKV